MSNLASFVQFMPPRFVQFILPPNVWLPFLGSRSFGGFKKKLKKRKKKKKRKDISKSMLLQNIYLFIYLFRFFGENFAHS
jgi:hypothetical protein